MQEIITSTAMDLHNEILIHKTMIAENLVELCLKLKIMRDKKYYKELGFERFEEYTVQMAGIGERQAYTYIQAIEHYGEKQALKIAYLGITKMGHMMALPKNEVEDFASENKVDEMSAQKLKELVREVTSQGEQIDMLTQNLNQSVLENEDLSQKLIEIENERQKLISEQIDKISEIEVKLKNEYLEKLAEKPSDIIDISEQSKQEILDKHNQEMEALKAEFAVKYKEKIVSLEEEYKKSLAKKEQSEGNKSDVELLIVHKQIENILSAVNVLAQDISKISDSSKREKTKQAAVSYIENALADILR